MNFQQLRSIREAARCGYNLTEVANVLFTSQPGVSRQIRELEEELGVDIFVRNGKRLIGLTDPGKGILQIVEKLLQEAENLRQASREYSGETTGTLSVAALVAFDRRRLVVLSLRPRAVTRPASNVCTVMNAVLPTTLWPTMRTPQPLTEMIVFCLNVLPF